MEEKNILVKCFNPHGSGTCYLFSTPRSYSVNMADVLKYGTFKALQLKDTDNWLDAEGTPLDEKPGFPFDRVRLIQLGSGKDKAAFIGFIKTVIKYPPLPEREQKSVKNVSLPVVREITKKVEKYSAAKESVKKVTVKPVAAEKTPPSKKMVSAFLQSKATGLQKLTENPEVKILLESLSKRVNETKQQTASVLLQYVRASGGPNLDKTAVQRLFKDLEALGFGKYSSVKSKKKLGAIAATMKFIFVNCSSRNIALCALGKDYKNLFTNLPLEEIEKFSSTFDFTKEHELEAAAIVEEVAATIAEQTALEEVKVITGTTDAVKDKRVTMSVDDYALLYKEKGGLLNGQKKEVMEALIQGMTREEIASLLGLTVTQVYSVTKRAVKIMKYSERTPTAATKEKPEIKHFKNKFGDYTERDGELARLFPLHGHLLTTAFRKGIITGLISGATRQQLADKYETKLSSIHNATYNALKVMKEADEKSTNNSSIMPKNESEEIPMVKSVSAAAIEKFNPSDYKGIVVNGENRKPIVMDGVTYIPIQYLELEFAKRQTAEQKVTELEDTPQREGFKLKVKSISYRKMSGGTTCTELILSADKKMLDIIEPDKYVFISTEV